MQRRSDRSSDRRLLLACLTALLTGIVLGMSSAASAVSAPQVDPVPALTNDPAITYTWSGEGEASTTTCELSKGGAVVRAEACTSSWTTTLDDGTSTPDGEYVFVVTATGTDATTGEVLVASSLPVSTQLDTTAPDLTLTPDQPATGTTRTPSWTVGPDGTAADCVLTAPDGTDAAATSCPAGSWTADLTAGSEGAWTVTATTVDAAGNRATAVGSYVLDIAPGAPTVTAPAPAGFDTAPAWGFEVPADAAATCTLTGPTGAQATDEDCADGYAPTLVQGDGQYTLSVVLTDAAGASPAGSAVYRLDTDAPAQPAVGGPTGRISAESVPWTFAVPTDTVATCTVTRNGIAGPPFGCGPDHAETVTDGDWSLEVVLQDSAGNLSTPGTSEVVTIDLTAPDAPVFTAEPATPNAGGASQRFTWNYTATDLSVVECRTVTAAAPDPAWAPCTTGTSTVDTRTLLDGPVTLELRSIDDLGNATAAVPSTVVLDTTAPLAAVVTGTGGAGTTPNAVWTWALEADERATCRLSRNGVRASDAWTPCSSGTQYSFTEDGTYALEVRLTDDAGNTGPEAPGPSYELDRAAPSAPSVVAPASPGGTATVEWTVSGEDGTDLRCELLDGGTVVEAETDCGQVDGPTTVSRSLSGEGSWSLRVVLVDAAGNRSEATASDPYRLDLTAPGAPEVDGPTGPSNVAAVTWTWTWSGEPVTGECRTLHDTVLDGDLADDTASAWTACTDAELVPLSAEGVWHWQVRLTDEAGNLGAVGTSPAYLLDTTKPVAPTVTRPAAASPDPLPVFAVDGEADIAVECRALSVDPATPDTGGTVVVDWETCARAHTVDLTQEPDAHYVVEAVLVDAAGNRSEVGRSGAYELDTDTPDAPAVSGSAGDSPSPTPTWTWTGEAVPAQCRFWLDGVVQGDDWSDCATPYTPTLPSEGAWVLDVRLVDAAGNTSDTGSGPEYRYDETAPTLPAVRLDAPSASPGRVLTPSWAFSGETGAVLTCRLVGPDAASAWATCPGSPTVTDLTGRPQGTYRFEVEATDAAGNTSRTAWATYVLDTVAPAAATVTTSALPSSSPRASWTLRAPEPGLSAQCRLTRDGTVVLDWAACPVSTTGTTWNADLTGRVDGRYRLDVEVTDAAGNRSAAAGADYVYDTTAPPAVVTTSPLSPGSSRTPTWILAGEQDAVLQCRFDAAASFTPCATNGRYTPDLATAQDRSYDLTVRAVDLAGNVGPETRTTYLLDTTRPATPVVTGPTPSPGQDRGPAWRFTAEPGASAHCTLVRGTTVVASGRCSSPYSQQLSVDGSYVLSVSLIDTAGNVSAVGTASYALDTTAPALPVIVGPSSPSSIATPVFGFDAESGALVECRVSNATAGTTGAWRPCAEGFLTLEAAEEATYLLEVRATDAAGNVSAVASYAYEYDREAPAGLQDLVLPVSPGDDRLPEWSFSAPPGGTLTCRLTGPDGREVAGRCVDGFTPNRQLRQDGRYVLRVVVEDANGNIGTNDLLYVLDTSGPEAATVSPSGTTGTEGQVQWDWVGDPTVSRWECELRRDGRIVSAFAECVPGVQVLGQWGEGTYTLTVVGYDAVGNRGAEARGTYTWDAAGPAALGVTTTSPTTGGAGPVTWTFRVPSDATVVECGVRRDGAFVTRIASCRGGSYVMDLTGQPHGTYEVVVRFTDRVGNTTEQVRTYTYTASRTPAPPTRPRPGAPVPPAPEPSRPTTSPAAPTRSPAGAGGRLPAVSAGPAVLAPLAPERLRALEGLSPATPAGSRPPSSGQDAAGESEGAGVVEAGERPGLDLAGRGLSGATAVEAIRDVATETIKRPQLPIVLILLVLGFLLVQNRIDRLDPKLAGAALDGDTELAFRPLRPTAPVPPPLRPRAGGSPA